MSKRYNTLTLRKLNKIRRKIDCDRFTLTDFYRACPYSSEELSGKPRKRDYLMWRHTGMVWALLGGMSQTEASRLFGRTHSTAIHSVNVVLHAVVDGHGLVEVQEAVSQITQVANSTPRPGVPKHRIYDFISEFYDDDLTREHITAKIYDLLHANRRYN